MKIRSLLAKEDWSLAIVTEDGRRGIFDVKPYLDLPAFRPLREPGEFFRVQSGGYFVEWPCGVDFSVWTIEKHLVAE